MSDTVVIVIVIAATFVVAVIALRLTLGEAWLEVAGSKIGLKTHKPSKPAPRGAFVENTTVKGSALNTDTTGHGAIVKDSHVGGDLTNTSSDERSAGSPKP